jgi:hypothetical protein
MKTMASLKQFPLLDVMEDHYPLMSQLRHFDRYP